MLPAWHSGSREHEILLHDPEPKPGPERGIRGELVGARHTAACRPLCRRLSRGTRGARAVHVRREGTTVVTA